MELGKSSHSVLKNLQKGFFENYSVGFNSKTAEKNWFEDYRNYSERKRAFKKALNKKIYLV